MPADLANLAIKEAIEELAKRDARIKALETTLAARTEEIRRYVQAKMGGDNAD